MASGELFTAFVRLATTGRADVERDLSSVESAGKRVESSVSTSLKNVGASITSAGKSLTTFATVPLAGMGVGMLKLASDAEETGSKFDTVFGKQAPKMNAWITDLQKIMPATRAEIQEMAASMNLTLEGMGLNEEQAAKMSQQYVTLAGDLASFNNIPVAEAHDAINAAMRGEYDTLQKFVPTINAAAVEQKAMEMGLAASTSEIDAQDKALAINKLLLEGTKDAQGDMARTADSTANSMKDLWTQIKELGTELGQNLIPVITPVVQKLSDLARWIGDLSPKWQAVIVAVAAFVAALGPVLLVTGMVISSIGSIVGVLGAGGLGLALSTVLAPIAAFAAAVVGIAVLATVIYKNWGPIKGFFIGLWNGIKSATSSAWNGIKSAVQAGVNAVRSVIMAVWGAIGPYVQTQMRLITGFVRVGWTLIKTVTAQVWNGIKQVLQGAWNFIKALIRGDSQAAKAALLQAWNGMKQATSAAWNGIKQLLKLAWVAIKVIFRSNLQFLGQAVKAAWNGIKAATAATWNGIKAFFRAFWNGLKALFRASTQAVWNGIEAAWNGIKAVTIAVFNGIKAYYTGWWNAIKTLFKLAWEAIRLIFDAALRAIRERVEGWGRRVRDIWTTFSNWAKDLWKRFWTSVSDNWSNSMRRIREKVEGWRDRIKQVVNNMKDGVWEAMKSVGRAFWEPIAGAYDKVKEWVNKLIGLINPILKRVGIDEIPLVGGGGGQGVAAPRMTSTGRPVRMAKGGVLRNGGVAEEDTVLYGEAGPEAYVRLDKRTPESQKAAQAVMRSPNAPKRSRGPLEHRRRGGAPPKGPVKADALGGTHHNVYDFIKKRADEVVGKFGGSWNTYTNHVTTSPANEHSTVDFWGPGGRGDPVGAGRGQAITDYIMSNIPQGLVNMAWAGQMWDAGGAYGPIPAPYSGHFDHNHTAWAPDPNAKIVKGSGGTSGFNPMRALFEQLWKRVVQPIVDRFIKPMKDSDNVMAQMGGGLAEMVPEGIKKWVLSKLGGGSSGPGSNDGTVKEWIKRGLEMGGAFPATGANIDTMYGRAMQESGGDPRAVNRWDSNWFAGTPSKGLFQVIEPTWEAHRAMYGADMGSFADNWAFGDKSAAVASRYMKARYGHIVGASSTGYSEGGLAVGPQLMALAENAGRELVLPLDNAQVARSAQTALGTTELRNELAGLRADLRSAGIKVADFGDAATSKVTDGHTNGARRLMNDREGGEIIQRQTQRKNTVRTAAGRRK